MDLEARLGELFAGFAAHDVNGIAALCAPGCRVRQNDGPESDVDTALAWLQTMLWDAGITTAYSEIRRVVAGDAVAEEHVVTLTNPDGVEAFADVCVVVRFDSDGLIVRLDEYGDTSAFAQLFS